MRARRDGREREKKMHRRDCIQTRQPETVGTGDQQEKKQRRASAQSLAGFLSWDAAFLCVVVAARKGLEGA